MPKSYLARLIYGDKRTFASFRFDEIRALADQFCPAYAQNGRIFDEKDAEHNSPFLMLDLPNDEVATQIAKRMVLMKSIGRVWGQGRTLEELLASAKRFLASSESERRCLSTGTFKIRVFSFGISLAMEKQMTMVQKMLDLGWTVDVDMKSPDNVYWIFMDFGHNAKQRAKSQATPADLRPQNIYFCREIRQGEMRQQLKLYSLKTRPFIGPTSTLADLAFIMANMGKVRRGSLVLDPFVGTASLLVACGALGATCMGGDMDFCLLHSKTHKPKAKKKDLFMNFKHYNVPRPEIVCCDNSCPPWRRGRPMFDAIICDPPYGVRAGARKTGNRRLAMGKPLKSKVPLSQYTKPHVPSSVVYPVEDVMEDLVQLAAEQLVVGGRLVYLLPTYGEFQIDQLPQHECLQFVTQSAQYLTGGYMRRCITVEKVKEWAPGMNVQRRNKQTEPAPSFANVAKQLFPSRFKGGSSSKTGMAKSADTNDGKSTGTEAKAPPRKRKKTGSGAAGGAVQ